MMMTSGGNASKYTSSIDCFNKIMANEGMKSMFKGAGSNVLRGLCGALVLVGFDYVTVRVALLLPPVRSPPRRTSTSSGATAPTRPRRALPALDKQPARPWVASRGAECMRGNGVTCVPLLFCDPSRAARCCIAESQCNFHGMAGFYGGVEGCAARRSSAHLTPAQRRLVLQDGYRGCTRPRCRSGRVWRHQPLGLRAAAARNTWQIIFQIDNCLLVVLTATFRRSSSARRSASPDWPSLCTTPSPVPASTLPRR